LLLYYITDRSQFPGSEAQRRTRLLDKIAEAARAGVDFIQLREKDLSSRDLESLAHDGVSAVRETRNVKRETKFLINHRADIALAAGAAGVHLRSDDIPVSDARTIFSRNVKRETRNVIIAVSCHTQSDLALAASQGADLAVFAPIFEKSGRPGAGLEALRSACRATPALPVLALGGVTLDNAQACLDAGAAGIAAIRLFQEGSIQEVVAHLRAT
jgi:thiamine-phosphate pyrophosphorylase